ncbi:MAG: Uma2 family endonuclease [Oscillospiraceae bacterium]|nr:Uma2 family endonuclease [Oscillospiraceae bacterium]
MSENAKKVYIEPLKREIINGKVYLMAGASTGHDDVVGNLRFIFEKFLRGKPCKLYGESANVYFDEDSPEVMPDLKIICDRSKIYKGKINGAPDLIIEVLSLRTKVRDATEKKDLYEKNGVREYWMVDPSKKTVEVYLLKDGKFVKDYVYNRLSKFEEYDVEEIESSGTEDEKKLIQNRMIKTSLFGDDLIIDIDDIFYDMIED